jgi:Ca2+-binding RTX toxin-like protein
VTLTSITLAPSCGILVLTTCPMGLEDPGVFALSGTGTGTGSGCAGVSFSIALTAGAEGRYQFTPANPVILPPAGACTIIFTFNALKAPTKDANAGSPGIQTVAIATVSALSGANSSGATTITVSRATPTLATDASGPVAIGGQVSDTATVSGGVTPTGTVTFRLYSDAACTTQVNTSTTALSGGQATSAAFTPAAAGTYHWTATYSGDANNNAVGPTACTDPAESVMVLASKVVPTLVTTASGVSAAGQIIDTATLSGGLEPTGTIVFRAFGPNNATCSGAPAFTSPPRTVTGNGIYTSSPYTPTASGTYRWVATYSGDAANEARTTGCNDAGESVNVTLPPPGGGTKIIMGTAGNDTLVGTPGNDVIVCGDGNDVVRAGAGNDVIICGAGNDKVDAGAGNDQVDGGTGNDSLTGAAGADKLFARAGKDRASGGAGKDAIAGGSGNDRLGGGAGADSVSGEAGRDSVSGNSGPDRLFGGSGRDVLLGGSGNDRLRGGPGLDRLIGGPGKDDSQQ